MTPTPIDFDRRCLWAANTRRWGWDCVTHGSFRYGSECDLEIPCKAKRKHDKEMERAIAQLRLAPVPA